jgi:hypothetical protein
LRDAILGKARPQLAAQNETREKFADGGRGLYASAAETRGPEKA